MFTITSASVRCKLASVKERGMKVVTIHAARDLRIEERDEQVLGNGQVEITVGAGGICGSDLHYYLHGGFGTVRLQEPMIVGHEVAGTVRAIGPGVTTVKGGSIVPIKPPRCAGLATIVSGDFRKSVEICGSTAAPCVFRTFRVPSGNDSS